ncbi:antigenic cell wall galactomannoprotein, putative [Metarhizium acridum CQMa 102]|uniref:Antigenic cell wall galactomannoprotein, putative n=1 Tax=Metarhizium acridum (strain CQMa 102) TaxID=655827 RepID=E9E7K4_METAQ|nr:antigenic cell wall galactomannoprotein, putative [Metarhizium acridum CQMa 102]EFY88114.1 antigenic cell wall galactomannoprotein, putative [Metarhizium acridum CQMa 102]
MKFLLFASTALALVRRQGDVLSADVAAIVTSVTALQTQVNNFQGAAQADALIAASDGVVAAIKKGIADANASPPLTQEEAFTLVPPLNNLIGVVNKTVGALVAKKQIFADSGRGCEVYPQLVKQGADSKAFSDALVAKVPDALKGIAGQISAPILQSLADGAAAFKDVDNGGGGTSASSSASNSATQTGTASGTATSSGSATGTETSGAATGTTEPCATETGSKTHTASATATATGSEPCDETTTVEVPVTETIPCTTTGGSGSQTSGGSGSQPTGGSGSHPTGGPGSQPTGGSGSQPTGGSGSQPTGGSGTSGSQPTGGSGSQPTGGSGSQPTGGSGCPGCAPGETSPGSGSGPNPTTLVPVPSGGEGGHGGSGGNGGNGGSPSPSSPVIVAGASRGEIPLAVAIAAIVGAVGAAL